MKRFCNTNTGEVFTMSADDRHRQRIARLRHRVYHAIQGLLELQETLGGYLAMYTLTYADIDGWKPGHMKAFADWLKETYGEDVHRVYVMELQRRGAPHYHVLCYHDKGVRWTKPTASNDGWPWGITWVNAPIRKPNYILKYLSKERQKNGKSYPRAARIVGYSPHLLNRGSEERRELYNRSLMPRWAITDSWDSIDWLCAVRVGSAVAYGVEFHPSPYRALS